MLLLSFFLLFQLGPTTITSPNPFTPPITVNSSSPNPVPAPFNTPTMFNGRMTIKDQGFGTFTLGDYPRVGTYSAMGGPVNWNQAKARVGGQLGMPFNEWGLHIATNTPTTGSGISYEKAGLFISSETADPSNYGSGISRDVVGADIRGSISGTALGRAWGINPWAAIMTGSDGLLTGIEVDINNNGSRQDSLSVSTSKTGIIAVSLGTYPGTVANAVVSSSTSNAWARAYWSGQDYLLSTGSFLELTTTLSNTCDNFRVKPTGQTLVGILCNNSSLNDYDPAVYGQLVAATFMTIPGGGSLAAEKRALYLFSDSSVSKHRIGGTRYDSGVTFWPVTLETAGNEVIKATLDPFVQLTTSYTGGNLSAAGTVALRNNAGVLEVSQNGGAWISVAAGTITGSGTANRGAKFTGATSIGNMVFTDDGTNVYPAATNTNNLGVPANLWKTVEGVDFEASSRYFLDPSAPFGVAGKSGTELQLGDATAATWASIRFYLSSATPMVQIDTNAGGSVWTNGDVLANAGYFLKSAIGGTSGYAMATPSGNILRIGDATAATWTTLEVHLSTTPVQFTVNGSGSVITKTQLDQNAATYGQVENDTSGTSAQAVLAAASGSGGTRIALVGVTSASFTTASGIPASSAYLSSGPGNTGGLYLQAAAGSSKIHLQAGGTSDNCTLDSAGLLTCTTYSGSGSQLTNTNVASAIGQLPIANGGTNAASFTSNHYTYYNATSIVSGELYETSSNVHVGSNSLNIDASGQGVLFNALGTASSISGSQHQVSIFTNGVSGTEVFRVVETSSDGTCVRIGGSLQRLSLSGSTVIVSGAC